MSRGFCSGALFSTFPRLNLTNVTYRIMWNVRTTPVVIKSNCILFLFYEKVYFLSPKQLLNLPIFIVYLDENRNTCKVGLHPKINYLSK